MEALNRPKRFELLFRASEHNVRAAAFHAKCDKKEDTVVIVRTEFGKTIGRFTHYTWASSSEYLGDPGRKCFLFSLDREEKFVPQGDKLIYRYSDLGPYFGVNDLVLSDRCNNFKDSNSSFPNAYNRVGSDKIVNN